jgi:2,3-bisphosphoglycerate-dependent phosphoglycerate mutase
MSKSILLIRHAQSANNALPDYQRVPDPALTPLGEQQAELLAKRLARHNVPISELICSPFKRSLDTTLPISRELKLNPTIRSDIYEVGGCYSGHEPGKKRGEPGMCCNLLSQHYPQWTVDPRIGPEGWNVGRDFETEEQVVQRASDVSRWLSHQWQPLKPDTVAALIIHADFKRVLIEQLLQTNRWPGEEIPVWNTAVSWLEYDGDRWVMLVWNSTDHLPADLRT